MPYTSKAESPNPSSSRIQQAALGTAAADDHAASEADETEATDATEAEEATDAEYTDAIDATVEMTFVAPAHVGMVLTA